MEVPEEAPLLKQFSWVTEWLTKNNLLKTLDTLLEEYNDVLSENITLEKRPTLHGVKPVSSIHQTFTNIHKTSILSVRFHPTHPWLISTDTAKNLVLSSRQDGTVLTADRTNNPFMGAIISLDCNPTHPNLLIIGTMDERHALLSIAEGPPPEIKTLQIWNKHSGYVIRVKWSPNGRVFATASHDKSVLFYELEESLCSARQLKQITFSGCVEAIEFTKDSKQLIASIREDPCLQYIQLYTWEVTLANSNILGDDHVSFNILELKSSDGKLLALTDHSRAILFLQGTPIQLHNLYGFENDGYSQPKAVFDKHGFIYLTSQDNCIYVFDVHTGQLIEKDNCHSALIRDIDYLPKEDMLVSCSYDKTIKIWKRKTD